VHDDQPRRSDGGESGSPSGGIRSRLAPPRLLLGVVEQQRAMAELAGYVVSLPVLRRMPRGDGHPVLVLPGFLASDRSTVALRSALRSCGHAVHEWGLGRNLGPRAGVSEGLVDRLDGLHRAAGRPVSLVGWSLGGMYARILARRRPEAVRQVITLGSPFRMRPGDRTGSTSALDALDPQLRAARNAEARGLPLPVPSTAIYSRTDGVVRWQLCVESRHRRAENIEVVGSHCGLGHNPAAVLAVGDRLAQAEGSWRPFSPPRHLARLYPAPAWWKHDRHPVHP
jgi:pimeloyl-ACP methyl ester carboxylesterase